MQVKNRFKMTLLSCSANESFARTCVSAFASQLDPTLEELSDIKTAVSEAITNCIVHAYKEEIGNIYISAELIEPTTLKIKIRDKGCGIEDVEKAMEPLYSGLGGERAGLGFTVMNCFMDKVTVKSSLGKGTTVTMVKKIALRIKANG